MYTYGTKVFTKSMGYFGQIEECPQCHKKYKKEMIRAKKWAHFDEIPIIPAGTSYYFACPVCGLGKQLDKKDAEAIMQAPSDPHQQSLETYAKRLVAKKPKKLLDPDKSYELWVRDLITGEDMLVKADLSKMEINMEKKDRGLKKMQIIQC